ncbi:MAG: bifunctional (p)ppGpp synthetase/guanosine-3',5'-bis(diphosphate) 3'-pyrophosphohydrolase [Parcubacteria group bacterium]|nr:bifunctional (p)ppGpp synthetase/guanosine-3',5'-bis(diphosphate) 3'-pyrophosphohydrolase [Parcubacteria group bacterium]
MSPANPTLLSPRTKRPIPDRALLLERMKSRESDDRALVSRAYAFSEHAHAKRQRFSGEPYFVHTFSTALYLAELGMDARTIAAGLLHDVLEDEEIRAATLENEFGKEVAFLVQGVTKLGTYKYRGLQRHAESVRKFLLAVAKDARVLIIKLADRLHNLETLEHVREDKRRRIALETLEIYAPIANRLGIGQLKGDLEDLSFPYVYPAEYAATVGLRKQKGKENQKYLEKVHRSLQKELATAGIRPLATDYREKHLYSLYQKLKRYDMDIEKIYDIAALRIVLPTVADCYQTLGVIHSVWRPLPGRIKDYIASPKPNGYQSLHTTIFTGDGGIAEIQIRTAEMHREAEFGIAAHLAYKEGAGWRHGKKLGKKYAWIAELSEWQKNFRESAEFLENLKTDFFKDRVFIFTPHGDIIDLPDGATPIDFAYAVHSDVGNCFAGAKINGKLTSLETKLKSGDIVEIVTKKQCIVSPKWLEHVTTSLARKHIKAALQRNKKRA